MGKMVRAISEDGSVMVCATDTTDIVGKAEKYHKTSAVVTAALGRMLTGASMMGSMLKGENDHLTLKINGSGATGTILVISDWRGNVKGYSENNIIELPLNNKGKLDVGGAVGTDGFLTVIKDMGLKEPYIGQVPIISGEIAEDITGYYARSEQTPTVCSLGVLVNPDLTVKAAGGFMIQLLPYADDDKIDIIEKNIKNMDSVTNMLEKGMTAEEIALKAIEGTNPNVLDSWETAYRCECSRKRAEDVLISIGKQELDQICEEDKKARVECHFCDKTYDFTLEELQNFILKAKGKKN